MRSPRSKASRNVPAAAGDGASGATTTPFSRLEELRRRIGAIERAPPSAGCEAAGEGAWRLGVPEIDRRLAVRPGGGLDAAGVHEIKPALGGAGGEAGGTAAAAWSAARLFALGLAVRRLAGLGPAGAHPRLLWVATAAAAGELGGLYGPGLAALGLAPRDLVLVEPARSADVLWAIEEGLKSGGLALVIGLLDAVPLTPARRLSLAAAGQRTPCLLLTHPRHPPAAATATRWRIAPAPSRPHPFDAGAPGPACVAVTLERCRAGPPAAEGRPLLLEWSDEAHRFRLAREPRHRPAAPRRAGGGAG